MRPQFCRRAWPLVSGVFTFPWRRANLAKWLSLSVGATLITGLGLFGLNMRIALPAIGPAVLCLAACWAALFVINLLTILGDTAAGADSVGAWPNSAAFLDWFGSTFFVVNSLALGLLAGRCVGWLFDRIGLPGDIAVAGITALLFPFLLLSMLEANSPLVPLSKAVCRSLIRTWRAWVGFYLAAIALLAVAGGIVIATTLAVSPLLAIPLLAGTLVASSMVYFRLLGRLAWCCSQWARTKNFP